MDNAPERKILPAMQRGTTAAHVQDGMLMTFLGAMCSVSSNCVM